MREGEILRNALRVKGIKTTEVAKAFDVSRTSVYQYFQSEQLSIEVKRKFREIFSINIDNADRNEQPTFESNTNEESTRSIDAIRKERSNLSDQIYILANKLSKTIESYDKLKEDYEDRFSGLSDSDPPGVNLEAVRKILFKNNK